MICKICKSPITTSDIFVADGETNTHYWCVDDPNALRKFIEGQINIGCLNWKTTTLRLSDHK